MAIRASRRSGVACSTRTRIAVTTSSTTLFLFVVVKFVFCLLAPDIVLQGVFQSFVIGEFQVWKRVELSFMIVLILLSQSTLGGLDFTHNVLLTKLIFVLFTVSISIFSACVCVFVFVFLVFFPSVCANAN
jgi:hypothetical protein